MCSGKTKLINQLKKQYELHVFDIKEFYVKHGILDKLDGDFDWPIFRDKIHHLAPTFRKWFNSTPEDAVIVIESSGTGKYLNPLLLEVPAKKSVIRLKTPTESQLKRRTKARGAKLDHVIRSKDYYISTEHYKPERESTVEEALVRFAKKMEGTNDVQKEVKREGSNCSK